MTRHGEKAEPFIPGSSLRGPLRHALSRRYRAHGETIRDPNGDRSRGKQRDEVEALFGSLKSARSCC